MLLLTFINFFGCNQTPEPSLPKKEDSPAFAIPKVPDEIPKKAPEEIPQKVSIEKPSKVSQESSAMTPKPGDSNPSQLPASDPKVEPPIVQEIPIAPPIGLPPPGAIAPYENIKAKIKENLQKINEAKDKINKGITDSAIDESAQSLLIFLDDSEIASSSIPFTTRVIAALSQKAGPMLITTSLLSRIFTTIESNPETDLMSALLLQIFDAREWTIKRLGEEGDFFLLIPDPNADGYKLGFMLESGPKKREPIATDAKDSFMNYIKDNNLYELYKNKANDRKLSEKFLRVFKDLFIPKSEYEKNNSEPPKYIMLLGGHGGFDSSIAGLSIDGNPSQFQQLLDILDKRIVTKIFVYISCYAAGFNAKKIYGELTSKGGTRTYPFPIATEAIGDASTYMGIISPLEGKIFSEIKHDEFIKEAKKEVIDIKLALSHIFPLIKRGIRRYWEVEITGLSQIRPANAPAWFPVNQIDEAVIRIGHVMALTRTEPVFVKPYLDINGIKQDPKAILFAAESVPFKIIMDNDLENIPPFISIAAGLSVHELAYVDLGALALDINKLTAEIKYGAKKLFWIKRLFSENKKVNYRDVIIESQGKGIKAYGTLENTNKPLSLTDDITIPPNYTDYYQALSKKMRLHSKIGLTVVDLEKRSLDLTPLMVAAYLDDKEGVRMLVEAGANVNAKNTKGKDALFYARKEDIRTILKEAIGKIKQD